jgi:opacity protein-like surface antigen
MGMFCRSIAAIAVLTGVVTITIPAVAEDDRGPVYFDQLYLPVIWQGLYGGVHLGWGWSGDANGIVGGGQIGYNWQSRQFVYGLEADVSAADIGVSETFVVPGAVLSASASIDWLATIRGRVGILVQPNLLIYGTAGLAVVHAEAHASVGTFGFGGISVRESDTETGLVYGIGVETRLTEKMSARLEYLGFSEPDRIGDFGILRAGLNFKIGP